jgi:hypothetical protein
MSVMQKSARRGHSFKETLTNTRIVDHASARNAHTLICTGDIAMVERVLLHPGQQGPSGGKVGGKMTVLNEVL